MSTAPPVAAVVAAGRLIRRLRLVRRAIKPNGPIDENRAATNGHIPAAVVVRASERKNIPTATPESRARPKPGGKPRGLVFPEAVPLSDAGRLTRAIPTRAPAPPASVNGGSRSPMTKAKTTGII